MLFFVDFQKAFENQSTKSLTIHGNICCHFGSSFLTLDSNFSSPPSADPRRDFWMIAVRGGLGVLVHILAPLNFEGQGFSNCVCNDVHGVFELCEVTPD